MKKIMLVLGLSLLTSVYVANVYAHASNIETVQHNDDKKKKKKSCCQDKNKENCSQAEKEKCAEKKGEAKGGSCCQKPAEKK